MRDNRGFSQDSDRFAAAGGAIDVSYFFARRGRDFVPVPF
jgi:hypothetical protein